MAADSLSGIQALLQTTFQGYATKLIVAIIILLFGFIIGRVVGKVVGKLLKELEISAILRKTVKLKIPVEEVVSEMVMYFIYFVTIIMALSELGLATSILNIILGAFMVIIVLAIFLSIKDFVPNFISGIYIHQKQSIKEGDLIKINNIEGRVKTISIVETVVETKKGDTIYIPNSVLTKSEVVKIRRKK
jgi:small conductance mechanosensitive channel